MQFILRLQILIITSFDVQYIAKNTTNSCAANTFKYKIRTSEALNDILEYFIN